MTKHPLKEGTAADPATGHDLMSTVEVCEALRVGRTTLWKLERTTDFPKHVSYGMRMKRWRRSDIAAYLARQTAP